jgi:2',3'-cyclic-nucleotide 2'-phosphodiesterase (5'-nucleotidase family)
LATLLPHPSKVAVLTLTGTQIREVLEQSATNQASADPLAGVGGLIQSDGLVWSADLRRLPGERVQGISVGRKAVDPKKRYRVVINAGMLGGIHKYETFARGEEVHKLEQTVLEMVESAFRRAGTVTAPTIGDVTLRKPEQDNK